MNNMIRKLTPQDKTDFLTLLDEFYLSLIHI